VREAVDIEKYFVQTEDPNDTEKSALQKQKKSVL
jgi:hypothetical protein